MLCTNNYGVVCEYESGYIRRIHILQALSVWLMRDCLSSDANAWPLYFCVQSPAARTSHQMPPCPQLLHQHHQVRCRPAAAAAVAGPVLTLLCWLCQRVYTPDWFIVLAHEVGAALAPTRRLH